MIDSKKVGSEAFVLMAYYLILGMLIGILIGAYVFPESMKNRRVCVGARPSACQPPVTENEEVA